MHKPSKADIDAILQARFPNLLLIQAFASMEDLQRRTGQIRPTAIASTPNPFGTMAEIDAHRAHLESLPASELAELAAKSRERLAAQSAAERAKKEASRFYNQASARADFVFWCKADYWTADEAAALLLGRDPRVVKPETLAAELSKPKGLFSLAKPPVPAEFHHQYEGLRALLGRASGLQGPALTPRAALEWATRTKAVNVPAQLAEALSFETADKVASADLTNPKDPLPPPSLGTPTRWSPEMLERLSKFRELHGAKAAAKEFGISEARVRQLLPSAKRQAPRAGPFDGWIHRSR